jgi:RimJ/RimL family protein N-acetyltransferase
MNANAHVWPQAPVLETARLRLRLHRTEDIDARTAMTGDSYVMRHFDAVQTREDNWARLLRCVGHWALQGWGMFVIEEKESGRFVGEAGLMDFCRCLGPDFDGIPEGGWILNGWAEGKGYATEAMQAAMAWYEEQFGIARMVCIIAPGNTPSLRVARKLGFMPFDERDYHGRPVILHERVPG